MLQIALASPVPCPVASLERAVFVVLRCRLYGLLVAQLPHMPPNVGGIVLVEPSLGRAFQGYISDAKCISAAIDLWVTIIRSRRRSRGVMCGDVNHRDALLRCLILPDNSI